MLCCVNYVAASKYPSVDGLCYKKIINHRYQQIFSSRIAKTEDNKIGFNTLSTDDESSTLVDFTSQVITLVDELRCGLSVPSLFRHWNAKRFHHRLGNVLLTLSGHGVTTERLIRAF